MPDPLISICIPSFKKPHYVIRCLDSVLQQDYKNVEVIISDDSPDEDIKQAIEAFTNRVTIRYVHNNPPLKTPRNWNAALDLGRGEYVLLLHQDDWFHAPDALSSFVNALEASGADFVFCQNTAIDEKGTRVILQAIPSLLKNMADRPNHLLRAQVIGPPSNTMLRRSVPVRYDERMIWLVDVDYYSRLLKEGYRYKYIPRHLVSIGLHEDQATVFCRNHPDIIIRENVLFAKKIGDGAFKDILIFDYYWRFMRNNHLRSVQDLLNNGVDADGVPASLRHILAHQARLDAHKLKSGPYSKMMMLKAYIAWRRNYKAA